MVAPRYRVGHVGDAGLLGPGPAEDAQRGQALDDVEEMAAEPGQQGPLPPGRWPWCEPDQHGEHGHQRQRDGDDQRGEPVGQGDPDQHGQRHQDGQHELGQVAGEVGVEAVQAAGGQRGQLAVGARAGAGGRASGGAARSMSWRRSCDLTVAAARRAATSPPQLVAARAGQDEGQRDERPAQGGQADAGGGPGQQPGQQAGLGQDQAGSGQAQDDGEDQVAAGRGGMPEQPRVDRLGRHRHDCTDSNWGITKRSIRGWARRRLD